MGKSVQTYGYIAARAIYFDCVPERTPKGAKHWYCIALFPMLFLPMHMMNWFNVCCVRVADTETVVGLCRRVLSTLSLTLLLPSEKIELICIDV